MLAAWPDPETAAEESSWAVHRWMVTLRWVALLGVVMVLVIAGPVLDRLPTETTPALWTVTAALGLYNAALALLGRRRRKPAFASFGAQIAADCLALAAFLHFAGGVDNPFFPLFVLHVVNANIVLSARGAARVLVLAIALTVAIVVGEGTGFLPHHCLNFGEACDGALDLRAAAVLGALVLTLASSSAFTRFLMERVRSAQRRLAATVEALDAEKGDLSKARAAVETERARLQAIIDCMGDAVTFADPTGTVIYRNRRGRRLWGTTGHGANGIPFDELIEEIQRRPEPSAPVRFERDGRTFEATHSLVRGPHGETMGLVTVAREITDRLALEKQLMRNEQMSVVGKLAAAVAHEVNNPIGVIHLYSQHALATLPEESPVREHLETIRRNAASCRKIVADLLNLARPRRPDRRRVDLRRICGEVVDSIRPLAANAGVRLSSGRHPTDVPIRAWADAGMLHQAILNLALNAVEAAGAEGTVAIDAYETQDATATASAVEVRDTGSGIPAEDLERIFQPFYTTKESGTGLGLAVAETVVRSHGGRIDVESVVGRGSVFRIVLPESRDGEEADERWRRGGPIPREVP